MNIYDSNLDVIKRMRCNLYNGIMNDKRESNGNTGIQVTSVPTKDGNMTITVNLDHQMYRLNSIYQPKNEAQIWASDFSYQNIDNVTVMFGLGNGIFLRELMSKKREEDRVIVYEPSPEIFLHVLEYYDITDLLSDEQITIAVVGINENEFESELEKYVTWSNVETQIVCMHPQYEKMFLEGVKTFLTIISEHNNGVIINRNTVAYFSRDIIENTLKNLRHMKDSNTVFDLIGELPKNVPAIIVSAGPSLDKNIDLLRQAKGKSVIIATDTAMKFLYAHNIIPDFCVTLDAMKPVSYMDDPRFMEIPMFTKVESSWAILGKHNARKIFYNCQEYMNKLYEKVGKKISFYESGGSVATGAFSICAALGFERIVLIGQDLAYEGDRTHAGSLTDRIRGEEEGIRYVEGIYGEKVKTRHDWYLYLKWFEQAIEEVKSFAVVIDATEGGAKIQGSVVMTLREVIDQYCIHDIDCAQIIRKKAKTLTDLELNQIYRYMQDGLEEFDAMYQQAKRAKILCEQILNRLKNKGDFDAKLVKKAQEIGSINEVLEKNTVYSLVNEYVSELTMHVLKDIYKFTDDEDENQINTFKRAKSFYEAMISSIFSIKPMLEEAIHDFWATNQEVVAYQSNRVILMMQTGMSSTAYNHRILRKLNGKSMLEHSINRIKQSKLIDDIVIIASIYEEDDEIVDEAWRLGVKTFRGNEDDVLAAYYYAAKENRAGTVVRVNFACPLVDAKLIDDIIEYYHRGNCEIVSNAVPNERGSYPKGLEVEVFAAGELQKAYRVAKERYQRLQVMAYLYENNSVRSYKAEVDHSYYDWTLSTDENAELIDYVYSKLYYEGRDFNYNNILDSISQNS